RVPEIVIGLTVVALGTSTPELIVNIFSSAKGATDLALGNVIGSNNFNILIIMGLSAIFSPLDLKTSTVWKEVPFALFISVLVMLIANDRWFFPGATNQISFWEGIALLLVFALFLGYTHHLSRTVQLSTERVKEYALPLTFAFLALGVAGLIWGGNLVVKQAIMIARLLNLSEKVIALTIVAAGTSLPELATSVVAAIRKHADIAVGNVIGSSIFNLLMVLGVSSVIRPLILQSTFLPDFLLMILATLLLFVFMFVSTRHRLDRWQGIMFLLIYVGYAVLFLK
ncbi:MAG: sodium:calcium antiporter, partial [Candidatus Syntrophosphaera sp.]|nr:sodium:calcium antiporter [Candidatus Syntrophosphaera sp.]